MYRLQTKGEKIMTTKEYRNILKTIAEREKISVEEVEREMQRAIDVGFDNPDKDIQKEWKKILFKGDRPTAREVIEELSKRARNS